MGIKVLINVPDVDTQLASYDQVQVFRSTTGVGGPYQEITAATATGASLLGTEVGPFTVNGMYLDIRVGTMDIQRVTFGGTDPISTSDLALQVTAQITGLTGADVGGALQITTDGTGADERVEIVNGTALAALGYDAGAYDTGEAARLALVQGVTSYMFYDPQGTADDFYRYQFINSGTLATGPLQAPVQGDFDVPVRQHADATSAKGLVLYRGDEHTFRVSFFEDVEQTEALVPLDASKYPSYSIIDINGQLVTSGLATLDGSAGNYRVTFNVPKDAACSNDDRRWRVDFLLITDENRQVSHTIEFDVKDAHVELREEETDLKTLAFPGKELELFIRLDKRPLSVTLDVFPSAAANCKIVESAKYPETSGQPVITEIQDCGQYLYLYTIPAGDDLVANQTYTALWDIKKSLGQAADHAFQIVEVAPPSILPMFPSLRMVIDKYQKRRGTKQAYSDADLYEYLQRGLELVNSWHPLTGFNLLQVPNVLTAHWMIASSIYGLNAQHLLETDLQFSFSGQTVTLDYDHTANLDSAISRSWQWLQDTLTQAKTPLFRRSQPTGVAATRTYRYNGLQNFVFKTSSFNSGDYLSLLSNIGLL